MKKFIIFVGVLLISGSAHHVTAQTEQHAAFDFWIGEWDVYKYGTEQLVGKSSITGIMDGYGIREEYTSSTTNYRGTSLNKYNTNTNQWEQYYIDNQDLTLHLKGNMDNNKMILSNKVHNAAVTQDGISQPVIENRITWEQMGPDEVRQIWEQKTGSAEQTNQGTWKIIFDGHYRRRTN